MEEKNKECVICLEKYKKDDEIIKLECGHIFHEKCLNTWIETKNYNYFLCPICREAISVGKYSNNVKELIENMKILELL